MTCPAHARLFNIAAVGLCKHRPQFGPLMLDHSPTTCTCVYVTANGIACPAHKHLLFPAYGRSARHMKGCSSLLLLQMTLLSNLSLYSCTAQLLVHRQSHGRTSALPSITWPGSQSCFLPRLGQAIDCVNQLLRHFFELSIHDCKRSSSWTVAKRAAIPSASRTCEQYLLFN